jgi:hypothetical protein
LPHTQKNQLAAHCGFGLKKHQPSGLKGRRFQPRFPASSLAVALRPLHAPEQPFSQRLAADFSKSENTPSASPVSLQAWGKLTSK